MLQSGHSVTVLGGGAGPVSDLFTAARIPYRPLALLQRSINPFRDWAAYGELKEELSALGPDLVSAHTAKAGWIARAACEAVGIPAVYTPHGIAVGDRISAASGALFTVAERAAARWARAIICVSKAERRLALEKRVCEPEKLFVVHNGVPDVPVELRSDAGASPPRICSVARFEPPKAPTLENDSQSRLYAR
jgi:glycosyltransferase involved in cell wall biosynthesis